MGAFRGGATMWQSVIEYIQRVGKYGWHTVGIELLLIGVVLYAFLSFLQGTRGLRLMRGLFLLLVTAFLILRVLAAWLNLERIRILAEPLIYLIFFGSLIVFQPELRRALMRLGDARWLRRLFRETEQSVAPIIATVKSLAKTKTGALIAIERQAALGSIIENGIRIDATVTAELLRTIFWPGSALHDLGVIIQEGRIAAAACLFPLTDSDQLDPALGSRHRAAVGLSEDSDAVVIVVSEETGMISLAVEGKLHRGLTAEALERDLRELLQVRKQNSRSSSGR